MVLNKVKDVLVTELRVNPEKITLETHLENDLGADSLDSVNVIMALEEEFDISITDEAAQNIKTVGDLVNFIEKSIA